MSKHPDRKRVRFVAEAIKNVDDWCCEPCREACLPRPYHYRMAIAAINALKHWEKEKTDAPT